MKYKQICTWFGTKLKKKVYFADKTEFLNSIFPKKAIAFYLLYFP